jgi:hypothetical protein
LWLGRPSAQWSFSDVWLLLSNDRVALDAAMAGLEQEGCLMSRQVALPPTLAPRLINREAAAAPIRLGSKGKQIFDRDSAMDAHVKRAEVA